MTKRKASELEENLVDNLNNLAVTTPEPDITQQSNEQLAIEYHTYLAIEYNNWLETEYDAHMVGEYNTFDGGGFKDLTQQS